jgi:hypothetical protein
MRHGFRQSRLVHAVCSCLALLSNALWNNTPDILARVDAGQDRADGTNWTR